MSSHICQSIQADFPTLRFWIAPSPGLILNQLSIESVWPFTMLYKCHCRSLSPYSLFLLFPDYHLYKQHCIRAPDHQLLYTHSISFLLCSSPLQSLHLTATMNTSPLWYTCFSTDYNCLLFSPVVTEKLNRLLR